MIHSTRNCIPQLLLIVLGSLASCLTSDAQNSRQIVGGGCEDCEIMYVGIPRNISAESTSPGWYEEGQKLIVTGRVFQINGKTPAANVILYYWHTDSRGLYSANASTPNAARRHGHLRGWVKTDASGKYSIKTLRPAPYPGEKIPAHIHFSIKEPQINEYFADVYFDDDPLYLKHRKKYGQSNRTGTELLRILVNNGVQIAEHDIILGLNIPNYPPSPSFPQPSSSQQHLSPNSSKHTSAHKPALESGLPIGEDSPSFMPFHAWGADKGKRACPVCRYGRFHGIEYFVGNHPNWAEIRQWLLFLEDESKRRGNRLKAYFVYANEESYSSIERRKQLEELGKELGISKVALTFVSSLRDTESDVHLNKIHPEAENTIVIFKHRTIVGKYVNLKPTNTNFTLIRHVLEQTQGQYFHLPELSHE